MDIASTPPLEVGADLVLPAGASLPKRVRVAWDAIRALIGNEKDPVAGATLNLCLNSGRYEKLARQLARTEEGRRFLEDRIPLDGSALRFEMLADLAPGSIGHELVRHFHQNGITPYDSPFAGKTDVEFLSNRHREIHDIAHVLTGYRTDIVGEMELQAFMLGNLGIPSAALLLLFSLVHVVSKLKNVGLADYLRRLNAAYRRGKASEPLIGFRYELSWAHSTETVRDMLRIPALGTAQTARPNAVLKDAYVAGRRLGPPQAH